MATFPWNRWQKSSGLGGNIPMDYVATFRWTGWQKSVEYACCAPSHTRDALCGGRGHASARSQHVLPLCSVRGSERTRRSAARRTKREGPVARPPHPSCPAVWHRVLCPRRGGLAACRTASRLGAPREENETHADAHPWHPVDHGGQPQSGAAHRRGHHRGPGRHARDQHPVWLN